MKTDDLADVWNEVHTQGVVYHHGARDAEY